MTACVRRNRYQVLRFPTQPVLGAESSDELALRRVCEHFQRRAKVIRECRRMRDEADALSTQRREVSSTQNIETGHVKIPVSPRLADLQSRSG